MLAQDISGFPIAINMEEPNDGFSNGLIVVLVELGMWDCRAVKINGLVHIDADINEL